MNLLRPEAQQALLRYREALFGAGLAALGLWWAVGSFGLLRWLALVLAALGGVILWSGLRRARIQIGGGGVGVVQIDERQIAYLAPVGGGFASLDDVGRIEIGPDRAGLPVWRLQSAGGVLTIPVRAEGAAALFDALTALPGADIDAAIRAARGRPADTVVIWYRSVAKLH